jgi:hypothetical protein
MNRNIFLLLFLYGAVFGSNVIPSKEGLERFGETKDRAVREEFEDSWKGKFCRSNIPPIITGMTGAVVGAFAGLCTGLRATKGFGGLKPIIYITGGVATGGFVCGYVLVVKLQNSMLKKFGIKKE